MPCNSTNEELWRQSRTDPNAARYSSALGISAAKNEPFPHFLEFNCKRTAILCNAIQVTPRKLGGKKIRNSTRRCPCKKKYFVIIKPTSSTKKHLQNHYSFFTTSNIMLPKTVPLTYKMNEKEKHISFFKKKNYINGIFLI